MKFSRFLRLEPLETRETPAQFGVPWSNSEITLSFAPDGTLVDGSPSNLFALMESQNLDPAAWQREILRAAQTWLETVDISVGVVGDSGAPLNTPAISQGDSRFGDIRISARPLSNEVLAISIPPGPASGSRSGDVIFNSNYTFGTATSSSDYDLYSVALQEIGHVLGVGNSDDVASPMFETYVGVRTGITAGDRANLQALYGQRVPDDFDLIAENANFGTASKLDTPAILSPVTSPIVTARGDLTTASDIDYYKFTAPFNSANSINIQLSTAGHSLLMAQLSVYSPSLALKGQSVAVQPLDSDVLVTLQNLVPGRIYYFSVEPAPGANPFQIGAYDLEINFNPTSPITPQLVTLEISDDNFSNETLVTATELTSAAGLPGVFTARAVFANDDVDVYRLHLPDSSIAGTPPNATTHTLTVTARSLEPGNGLVPRFRVTDSFGIELNHHVIRAEGGELVMQIDASPDSDVFVTAMADDSGPVTTGEYQLDATIHVAPMSVNTLMAGTLTNAQRMDYHSLFVRHSSVVQFVLELGGPVGVNNVGGQLTVFDKSGQAVLSLFVKPDRSVSAARYLAPGEYTLRLKGLTQFSTDTLPSLPFTVRTNWLSDPIGPEEYDPDTYNDLFEDIDLGDSYYDDQVLEDPGDPDW